MSFTLCLNTSTIQPLPLLEKIRLAGEAGYAGIELWINDLYAHVGRGGEIRDVEKALSDHGLIVPCTIALRGWAEAGIEEYPMQLDDARRRMELAARIGAPFIVATPPREACGLSQITERYRDLLALGRESGVRPTFEYISFLQSVWRLDQAMEVVEGADDDGATVILDAFHTYNGGGSLDDLKAVPVERISHYHFDDAAADIPLTRQRDPDRVMPGDGCLDLAAEVSVLREKGYQGTVSLELFNPALWAQDPRDVVKIGLERMRRFFGEAAPA